ncbi:hypothetical protein Ancab_027776 [Ancistrocladus abbreviatus]
MADWHMRKHHSTCVRLDGFFATSTFGGHLCDANDRGHARHCDIFLVGCCDVVDTVAQDGAPSVIAVTAASDEKLASFFTAAVSGIHPAFELCNTPIAGRTTNSFLVALLLCGGDICCLFGPNNGESYTAAHPRHISSDDLISALRNAKLIVKTGKSKNKTVGQQNVPKISVDPLRYAEDNQGAISHDGGGGPSSSDSTGVGRRSGFVTKQRYGFTFATALKRVSQGL